MSCPMLSAALRCPGLSLSERIVYASLCDRANAENICWPSAEALAHDHELSRRAVLSALTELKTKGLIEVRPRRRKTSIYRVLPCTPIPRYAHARDAAPEPEHPFASSEPIYGAEFAPKINGAEFAPIESAPVEVQILPFKGAKNDVVEVQNLHTESPIESPIESPTLFQLPPVRARTRAETEAEDAQRVFDAWNEMATKSGLACVRVLSPHRRSSLRTRIREVGGVDAMLRAVEMIGESAHCRGESERGWKADFDFLLQPDRAIRTLEGKYSGPIWGSQKKQLNPARLTGAGALLYKLQQENQTNAAAHGEDESALRLEVSHG